VIVSDIATDPLWKNYRKLALRHGLRSCWSAPIFGPAGEVLGSFALYYRAPRRPTTHEVRLVQVAAQLAALAIGRDTPRRSFWPDTPTRLSARELQIVRMIASGAPVKRIASGLNVSISTVYTHRARIFQKLNVDSNVGVAHYATLHQLL
jgi:DNA-binding CsgD family transcriptional regulator